MTALGNLSLRYRLPRRLAQLHLGLVGYGVSMAFMVRSRLGTMPWDVLHQGVARHTGLSFGTVVIALGGVVLLLWIPLRQRPGIGTVSNALTIGPLVQVFLPPLMVRAPASVAPAPVLVD